MILYFTEKVNTGASSLDSTNTSLADDYLDYGEKLIEPGESLHLPTVKTSAKLKDVQTYIVVKVSSILIALEMDYNIKFRF